MGVKLESDFTDRVKILFEHSLAIGGFSYLVIYGTHINGGFICLPGYGVGCEAASFANSIPYNTEKLTAAGIKEDAAAAIAEYIDGFLKGGAI